MADFGRAPIPLSRETDPDALARENPIDALHLLGSFWPNTRTSIESRIIKGFKECSPTPDYEPNISALCEFYCCSILQALQNEKPQIVVRVLGSSEAQIDPARPQSLLAEMVSQKIGAENSSHIFFKSGGRPPMRSVSHLSGSEALKTRIRYASQDLFIRPNDLGGTALLIDDIMNTGASVRVYASALKRYAGAERVICVNLAATRFNGGKDGHGMLKLDTSGLESKPGLEIVWIEDDFYHSSRECESCGKKVAVEMRFLAERKAQACPACFEQPKPKKKWWQIF